eukprot:765682-Hanusia_phi.AAC.3
MLSALLFSPLTARLLGIQVVLDPLRPSNLDITQWNPNYNHTLASPPSSFLSCSSCRPTTLRHRLHSK